MANKNIQKSKFDVIQYFFSNSAIDDLNSKKI